MQPPFAQRKIRYILPSQTIVCHIGAKHKTPRSISLSTSCYLKGCKSPQRGVVQDVCSDDGELVDDGVRGR